MYSVTIYNNSHDFATMTVGELRSELSKAIRWTFDTDIEVEIGSSALCTFALPSSKNALDKVRWAISATTTDELIVVFEYPNTIVGQVVQSGHLLQWVSVPKRSDSLDTIDHLFEALLDLVEEADAEDASEFVSSQIRFDDLPAIECNVDFDLGQSRLVACKPSALMDLSKFAKRRLEYRHSFRNSLFDIELYQHRRASGKLRVNGRYEGFEHDMIDLLNHVSDRICTPSTSSCDSSETSLAA